jgi:hypothetical protein
MALLGASYAAKIFALIAQRGNGLHWYFRELGLLHRSHYRTSDNKTKGSVSGKFFA